MRAILGPIMFPLILKKTFLSEIMLKIKRQMDSGMPIEDRLLIRMDGMTSSKAPIISRKTTAVYSSLAKPLYISEDKRVKLSMVDLALRKPNCEDGRREWCSTHHESLVRMRRSKSFNMHEARAMGRNLPGVDFGIKNTRNCFQLSGSVKSLRKSLKTDRRARRTLEGSFWIMLLLILSRPGDELCLSFTIAESSSFSVKGDSRKGDFAKRCEAGKQLCNVESGQRECVSSCNLFKTSVSDVQEGFGLSCLCRNLLTWFQIEEIEEVGDIDSQKDFHESFLALEKVRLAEASAFL